jgi:hypothetical protein
VATDAQPRAAGCDLHGHDSRASAVVMPTFSVGNLNGQTARPLAPRAIAEIVIVGVCVLVLSGCNSPTCAGVGAYGIKVDVRDSSSGVRLFDSLRVTAQDGGYVSTFRLTTDNVFGGADDRPGTYTITVQRPSYRTWQRHNVVVAATVCRAPITVELTALLQPL